MKTKTENKQYGHYSSAVRYIKKYEAKYGKQNFVINQLDENCFEVINCKKLGMLTVVRCGN